MLSHRSLWGTEFVENSIQFDDSLRGIWRRKRGELKRECFLFFMQRENAVRVSLEWS
jgi:hypothetical protein